MALAARGARETDGGSEPIGDSRLVGRLRQRALGILAETTVVAAVLTAFALLLVR